MELIIKRKIMKKILGLIILSLAMVSCYEDYLLDYTYSSVYFPNQQDVRTFVIGEGMKFKVGAALGGLRENVRDRAVTFELQPSLITPAILASMKSSSLAHIKNPTTPVAALEMLPSNYYTLSNSTTMIITTGYHEGSVVVKADSSSFLADSAKTINATYVLPFNIINADADTILSSKSSNVVGVKFENMLFGNYWHGGYAIRNRPALPDDTVRYYTKIPQLDNQSWTLTTAGPTTLIINAYANTNSAVGAKQLQLVIKGTKVFVSSAPGAAQTFTGDGECVFNNPRLLQDRRIYLKYKFTATTGETWHCTDTLRFRNRIRDGVNEWQDENPSHYVK